MTPSIRNCALSNVGGENVYLVCRRFRYASHRLDSNNSLSSDLIRSLFGVFQFNFQRSLQHSDQPVAMLHRKWIFLIPKPLYQEALNKASSHYSNVKCPNQCITRTALKDSVFKAGTSNKDKIKCLWCGGNDIHHK